MEGSSIPSEADVDSVMEELESEHKQRQLAFRMYIAGYEKRVQDEKEQSSALREQESFRGHIKTALWNTYDKVIEEI